MRLAAWTPAGSFGPMTESFKTLPATRLKKLCCWECGKPYPVHEVNTIASCEKCKKNVLLSNYDLGGVTRDVIDTEVRSMWRYFSLLPVQNKSNIISLGEGYTPVLSLDNLADDLQVNQLLLKDESLNPTGSFKARGMSAAISKAKEFGIRKCIVPTAGNAGGAMAAYCAKAGIEALVVMPEHTPKSFQVECEKFGARVVLERGLISDCAKRAAVINTNGEYFDLSTLKEPYRLEGKKTLGYEIAEQFNWTLPDVILYPTGGGTGLIGMWKAFHEMAEMGWIPKKFPRMYCVQSDRCCPIVETWSGRQPDSQSYVGSPTVANGLAVPNPMGEQLIIRVMKESSGTPVCVSETDIIQGERQFATKEGLLVGPEGAALYVGLKKLLGDDLISRDERILLMNTGSAYKYM